MRVRETSGIQWGVGKRATASQSIYMQFILDSNVQAKVA